MAQETTTYTREDVDRFIREIREWTDNDITLYSAIEAITGHSLDSRDNPLNMISFNESTELTNALGDALKLLLSTALREIAEKANKRLAELFPENEQK